MRVILMAIAFLTSEIAYADLFKNLRELRGTISETSRTTKEVNELSKQVTPEVKPEAQSMTQSTGIKSGGRIISKLGKLKLLREPNKKSTSLEQLSKADEMIFMGEETDGFYRVTAISGEGWVDKLLVQKR